MNKIMSRLTKLHTITLPEEVLNKARDFAKIVVDTTDYQDSNQSNRRKIIIDHFVSKLGEEAVKAVMEKNDREVIGPDYKIYGPNEKSWDSDLYVNGIGLAVKTQCRSAAERYGLSWTFQNIPDGRSDPVLSQPDAWVYFVEYIDTEEPANRLIVFPPKQIKALKFEDPVLDRLKGEKLVVYARSLTKEHV